MVEGSIILLVGILIGYYIRSRVPAIEKKVAIINHKKMGVIVDLTPPPEIGDPINEEEKPIE